LDYSKYGTIASYGTSSILIAMDTPGTSLYGAHQLGEN
jgi:hypothetical protein